MTAKLKLTADAETAVFIEFRPNMRRLIADAIESLILLLDEIDGDADFEADEPAEEDDEPEDDGLAEPSLGSIGGTMTSSGKSQTYWACGGALDLEDEHDGREP